MSIKNCHKRIFFILCALILITGLTSLSCGFYPSNEKSSTSSNSHLISTKMGSNPQLPVLPGKVQSVVSKSAGWDLNNGKATGNSISPLKIVFTSEPQTIGTGDSSAVITIQTKDAINIPANVLTATRIDLLSSSTSGNFSSTNTSWASITSVTIPAGSNGASFFYKDSIVGTPTIRANCEDYVSGTQQETIVPKLNISTSTIKIGEIGCYPDALAINPITNYIYAASTSSDSVSVINGNTNKITATISLGNNPEDLTDIAVNPVTNLIYTTNISNNSVSVISGSSYKVIATIKVGNNPLGVAVNPNTNRIYVTNCYSNTVSIIDGSSNQVIGTVSTGIKPLGVAVNPDTNYIYVANNGNNTVTCINGTSNTVIDTINVCNNPINVAVNPITNRIYVINRTEGSVSEINGSTNSVIGTINLGVSPCKMAINPQTNLIYLSHVNENWPASNTGSIVTVNGSSSTVLNTIDLGQSAPYGIVVNPVTGYLYCSISLNNSIMVINSLTNSPAANVVLCTYPYAVAVNPETNRLYVINSVSNNSTSLLVIDGPTNSVIDSVNLPDNPVYLAVNPNTNRIYTSLSASGNVSVIDGLTDKLVTSINLGTGYNPGGITVNPDTNMIYVSAYTDNYHYGPGFIAVIDGSTNNVVATINMSSPGSIAVNSRTNRIYVSDWKENKVRIIDGSSNTVITTVPVESEPGGIVINPLTNRIYISNYFNIWVINGYTNAIIDTIYTNCHLTSIALNPLTNRIYLASLNSNIALIIDGYTHQIISVINVGIWPNSVAVNSKTNLIYVVNSNSDSISIIQENNPRTTTTISASNNVLNTGELTTFTASVKGNGSLPTGMVTFLDNGNILEFPVSLNGTGQASLSTSNLLAGVHYITAVYGGDVNYSGSASWPITQTVKGNLSFNRLSSPTVGTGTPSVLLSGVVSVSPIYPVGGTVKITLNGVSQNATVEDEGEFSSNFNIAGITVGTYPVTYSYIADSIFNAVSMTTYLTVKVGTVTSISSSDDAPQFGQVVNFTVIISANKLEKPTGTVIFLDGITALGSISLDNSSQAICSSSSLAVGNHTIFVIYMGDSIFAGSFATLKQVIKPPAFSGGSNIGGSSTSSQSSKPVAISGLKSSSDLTLDAFGRAGAAVQLQTDDGNFIFDIPKDTILCDSTNAPLNNISAAVISNPPMPSSPRSILMAFEFGPEGACFNPSITLTVPLNNKTLPEGTIKDSLALAYWDGKSWITIDSKIDPAAGTIAAQISHFSQWALLAAVIPPAKFSLSDLKLSADKIKPGEMITIRTSVDNTGGSSGKCAVILKVNDTTVASKDITLEPGSSQIITFSVSKDIPGDYIIDINGKTAKFRVDLPVIEITAEASPSIVQSAVTSMPTPATQRALTPAPTPEKKNSNLWIMAIAGVVIAGLVVAGMLIWRPRKNTR
jgi:YVTN family beta-propeller protein